MGELVQAAGRGNTPSPIGVVYNTSMTRPDAALALAAMYAFANKRQARIGAVCVTGAGLGAATFCDIVGRFLIPGPPRNGNQALPVGLAVVTPLPPDPPMVRPALERQNPGGAPQYARSIVRVSDTSEAEAVLRNGVIFSAESAVVLSAPATRLARSLDLLGTKEQYKQRVRRLVIVDGGVPQADPPALRKIVAEWPGPVFYCGRDVGTAITLQGARVETAFAWAAAHPVLDAYRAYQPMPYDTPAHDLAAMHFTVQPTSGFFLTSEPGTLTVSDVGQVGFASGGGNVQRVTVDPAKAAQAAEACLAMAATEPLPPPAPRGRGAA